MATETSGNDAGSTPGTSAETKPFLAQAQEAVGSAVDATVAAVKEHPVAAAAIAAGTAAAIGGAAYAASQLHSDAKKTTDSK
jgi:hypothetical protein